MRATCWFFGWGIALSLWAATPAVAAEDPEPRSDACVIRVSGSLPLADSVEQLGKWFAKAGNGYHHSTAFTLMNFAEPVRIKSANAGLLNANCLYCHQDFVSEITAHRVIHDEELYCVRCHNRVGHGPSR